MKFRLNNYFTLFGNYTYSHAYDTSTDFNTDCGPQDPTNVGLDRGPSEFDERNRVTIAGVFDSPWKSTPIINGFQLAPIFNFHSGHPFNLLAAGEVNGNNHTTNERPIGAPRESGLSYNYYTFDMRLSWRHKLGEKANILLTAEGFNIANRTNYASVNNEVGPLFGFAPGFTTFKVKGVKPNFTTIRPSSPLVFTSDYPKRQIQLGAVLVLARIADAAGCEAVASLLRESMLKRPGREAYPSRQTGLGMMAGGSALQHEGQRTL